MREARCLVRVSGRAACPAGGLQWLLRRVATEGRHCMAGRDYLISTVRRVREAGRMALCGYFLTGFPNPKEFYRLVRAAQRLDIMEFGIPSSTPRLDGPTISRAHEMVVCERGLDAETSLALLGGLRDLFPPRLVMTYAEDGRSYHGFLRSCVCHGLHGLLAPDVDPLEARQVGLLARAMKLAFVRFVDLAMSPEAIDEAIMTSDVLYLRVAAGRTGGSATFHAEDCQQIRGLVEHARQLNPEVLLAGGIGIRRPDQVTMLAALGLDIAVVGTTLVEQLELGTDQLIGKVDELRQATLVS
jgi:tryptophan synthase alpha subunit